MLYNINERLPVAKFLPSTRRLSKITLNSEIKINSLVINVEMIYNSSISSSYFLLEVINDYNKKCLLSLSAIYFYPKKSILLIWHHQKHNQISIIFDYCYKLLHNIIKYILVKTIELKGYTSLSEVFPIPVYNSC